MHSHFLLWFLAAFLWPLLQLFPSFAMNLCLILTLAFSTVYAQCKGPFDRLSNRCAELESDFIIDQPSASTEWANGSPFPVSWTMGLLDNINSFDVELTRLNQDGLFFVALNGKPHQISDPNQIQLAPPTSPRIVQRPQHPPPRRPRRRRLLSLIHEYHTQPHSRRLCTVYRHKLHCLPEPESEPLGSNRDHLWRSQSPPTIRRHPRHTHKRWQQRHLQSTVLAKSESPRIRKYYRTLRRVLRRGHDALVVTSSTYRLILLFSFQWTISSTSCIGPSCSRPAAVCDNALISCLIVR